MIAFCGRGIAGSRSASISSASGASRQRGKRALHREPRRGDDAERVNLVVRREAGRGGKRVRANRFVQRVALRGREEFRIARVFERAECVVQPPCFDAMDSAAKSPRPRRQGPAHAPRPASSMPATCASPRDQKVCSNWRVGMIGIVGA